MADVHFAFKVSQSPDSPPVTSHPIIFLKSFNVNTCECVKMMEEWLSNLGGNQNHPESC